MTTLIAVLSSGKGTWGEVQNIISSTKWDKIYLLCNDFAYKNFEISPNIAIKLNYDENKLNEAFQKLTKFFKKEIKDFEIALSISSGTGREHIAIISSILKSGLGIRYVFYEDKELKEYELLDEKYIPDENEYYLDN